MLTEEGASGMDVDYAGAGGKVSAEDDAAMRELENGPIAQEDW